MIIVSGIIPILLGVGLILARRRVPRLIHAGLKRIYGEPFADTAINERTGPRWIILVGSVLTLLGVFSVIEQIGVLPS